MVPDIVFVRELNVRSHSDRLYVRYELLVDLIDDLHCSFGCRQLSVLGYRHDFQNSILGNFYYIDALYLNFSQAIAGRLALGLSGRYESRSFQGIQLVGGALTDRHDNYWQVGANLDYHVRAWTYVGVAYTLMKNDTDSSYMPTNLADPGPINYVKHLLFARLGVAY